MSPTFIVYILYSKILDRFYIGATRDTMEERLKKHNTNHKGFTGKANDWEIYYAEFFTTFELALAREKEIKNRKSRKYIENLSKS